MRTVEELIEIWPNEVCDNMSGPISTTTTGQVQE